MDGKVGYHDHTSLQNSADIQGPKFRTGSMGHRMRDAFKEWDHGVRDSVSLFNCSIEYNCQASNWVFDFGREKHLLILNCATSLDLVHLANSRDDLFRVLVSYPFQPFHPCVRGCGQSPNAVP